MVRPKPVLRSVVIAAALAAFAFAASVRAASSGYQARYSALEKESAERRLQLGLDFERKKHELYAQFPTPEVTMLNPVRLCAGQTVEVRASGTFPAGTVFIFRSEHLDVLRESASATSYQAQVRVRPEAGLGNVYLTAVTPVSMAMTEVPALDVHCVAEAPAVDITSTDELPLSFRLSVAQPKLKPGQVDLLAGKTGLKLLVHVFDQDLNVLKVDDRLQVNGRWDDRANHLKPQAPAGDGPEALQAASLPIAIPIERNGDAKVQLFVSFAKLALYQWQYAAQGVAVPTLGKPMRLTLKADLVGLDEKGKEVPLGSGTRTVSVDYVARVLAARFEAPQVQQAKQFEMFGRGDPLPVEFGALSSYAGQPFGDTKGARRVLVNKRSDPSFGTLGEPGAFGGVPLLPGDVLRPKDVVRFDTAAMVAHGTVDPQPPFRIQPGLVALRLRFLDGVECELRVLDDAGSWTMSVAPTPEETGFVAEGMQFAYFLGNFGVGQVKDKLLEWSVSKVLPDLMPGLGVVNKAKDVYEVFSWFWQQSNVQHVRINSRVYGEATGAGQMRVTTLEGAPVVYTPAAPRGVKVPAGQTSTARAEGPPVVAATDKLTAARAAGVLARPDQPAVSTAAPSRAPAVVAAPPTPTPTPTPVAPAARPAATRVPEAAVAPPSAPPSAGSTLSGSAQAVTRGREPAIALLNSSATAWSKCTVTIPGRKSQWLASLSAGFRRELLLTSFSYDSSATDLRNEVQVVCAEGSLRAPLRP